MHVYAPLRLIGGMVLGFNRQFMIIAIADRIRGRTSMRPYQRRKTNPLINQ
ncbi:hypothetical protein [Coleofasciculus sp.]|uniref:hypothetical protein n=1 Tax=Coleofasciculus sp. TaxID=3100458 RepID=UPI003A328C2D